MKKRFLALSIAVGLMGCGGGGESSNSKPGPSIPPTGNFNAYNGLSIVKPRETVNVDLRNYVEGGTSILSIISDDVNCTVPEMNQMSFSVKFETGAYCLYDYVVQNSTGQEKTATITVLSTSADEPTLPVISRAINVNSINQEFDLAALLGADWQPTYTLNPNSIAIEAGEDSVSGSWNASANTITFNAPSAGGLNRILYTVSDTADPDIELLGTIYISLSTNINDAPVINQTNYSYTDTVVASQSVTIDLASLPGLSITDDGDWQLIEVSSFTANVAELDSNSVNNQEFTFVTPTVGAHVVSYTVSDHMGGFATGLIYIEVAPDEQAKSWTDLRTTIGSYEVTFSAAPLYSEATAQNIKVSTYWDSVVENTVAAFSNEIQAERFCSHVGRIPKISELDTLRDKGMANALISGDFLTIPKQLNYLATADTDLTFNLYDFNTGAVAALTGNDSFYVTCANHNSFDVEVLTTNLIAGSDDYTIALVNKTADEPLTVVAVPESDSRLTIGDINLTVDDSDPTSVLIKANSTTAGTFRLQIDSSFESIMTTGFNILADKNSASITVDANADDKDESSQIYLMADGVDQLEILPHVTDQYSNDIADAALFYSGNSGNLVTSDSNISITDGMGVASFILTGDINETFAAGTYTKTYTYDLTIGQQTTPFTFELKHANYYDELEVSNIVEHGRYMSALLRVKSRAGAYRAANIEIVGGNRGSIFYSDDATENEGVLSDINVPVEGAIINVSHAVSNRTGSYTFALSGSPNRQSVSYDSSTKATNSLLSGDTLLAGGSSTQLTKEDMFTLIENFDVVEIYRAEQGHGQTIYLPQLTPSDFGKVVKFQNMSISGRLRAHNLSGRYFTAGAGNGSTTCPVNAVFWNGTDWTAFGGDYKPNMDIIHSQCQGSVLPD